MRTARKCAIQPIISWESYYRRSAFAPLTKKSGPTFAEDSNNLRMIAMEESDDLFPANQNPRHIARGLAGNYTRRVWCRGLQTLISPLRCPPETLRLRLTGARASPQGEPLPKLGAATRARARIFAGAGVRKWAIASSAVDAGTRHRRRRGNR